MYIYSLQIEVLSVTSVLRGAVESLNHAVILWVIGSSPSFLNLKCLYDLLKNYTLKISTLI